MISGYRLVTRCRLSIQSLWSHDINAWRKGTKFYEDYVLCYPSVVYLLCSRPRLFSTLLAPRNSITIFKWNSLFIHLLERIWDIREIQTTTIRLTEDMGENTNFRRVQRTPADTDLGQHAKTHYPRTLQLLELYVRSSDLSGVRTEETSWSPTVMFHVASELYVWFRRINTFPSTKSKYLCIKWVIWPRHMTLSFSFMSQELYLWLQELGKQRKLIYRKGGRKQTGTDIQRHESLSRGSLGNRRHPTLNNELLLSYGSVAVNHKSLSVKRSFFRELTLS